MKEPVIDRRIHDGNLLVLGLCCLSERSESPQYRTA